MAWTSARSRYKTQCVRKAVINKDILYFLSPWLFFHLSHCLPSLPRRWDHHVEVWKCSKKEWNFISFDSHWSWKKNIFTVVSKLTLLYWHMFFSMQVLASSPSKNNTKPLDNKHHGANNIFLLFQVFIKNYFELFAGTVELSCSVKESRSQKLEGKVSSEHMLKLKTPWKYVSLSLRLIWQ